MSKARDLADLISTGGILADGAVSVSEITDLTATAAELNVLDGITASTADLNNVAGINSDVQTQLDLKAPLASPTFTGTATIPTAAITTADFGNWTVTETGGALYFASGGTNYAKIDASGNLDVVGNVNTNATIT